MADVHPGDSTGTTVCAVVVTYNRPALLERCLDLLAAQSRPPDHVLVVDNASTDDTPQLLGARTGVEVLTMDHNTGSSGGFHRGVQRAYGLGHDWIWLLDDDTFPDERCLEELLAGVDRAPAEPSVMTSAVRWRDGRLHPMNRPWLRRGHRADFAEGAAAGLAAIRAATFVSTMVRRDAVAAHGLPPAHYFVWLDDIEFFAKILREGHGYLVPQSVAWHWTPQPSNTLTDARERFYFKARNHLWLLRGNSFAGVERAEYALAYLRAIRIYLRDSDNRGQALRTAARGVRDGLRREPA